MVVAVVVVGVLAVLGWLAWRGWVARAVAAGTAVMVVLAAAGAELTDNVVDHDGVSRADPAGLSWAVAHRE